MNRIKGFTLIELLVVIAIIAILAIAIVVAYGKAKEAAANSQRVKICREIATAQEMYYTENGRYCTYLEDLMPDYLASDPNDSKIGPRADFPSQTWKLNAADSSGSNYNVHGTSTGFKAQAKLSKSGEEEKWFCCNKDGCRDTTNGGECTYN
jgi:prepilin-type N-terminal cleavage/methylation domain-containing protein